MYLHEPVFDPDELLKCNYHIHTSFSRCGKTEMRFADIVDTAARAGLEEIALTDHIHPGEEQKLFRIIPILNRKKERCQTKLKIYIGAELSAYGTGRYTLKKTDYPLEYRLYSHNHYHMFGWEQPADRSPQGYRKHCLDSVRNVILSGKADCLAHPFTDYYIVREFEDVYGFTRGCVTSLFTDNDIGDLMLLSKEYKVAWELNTSVLPRYPDFAKKYFALGKETGVSFNVGTDAHRLSEINTRQYRDDFIKLIGAGK